jgi:hypothetical protein
MAISQKSKKEVEKEDEWVLILTKATVTLPPIRLHLSLQVRLATSADVLVQLREWEEERESGLRWQG